MKTRFPSLMASPNAGEGAAINSKFSTKRSPTTALLCAASRTVVLPLVREVSAAKITTEDGSQMGHSVQE